MLELQTGDDGPCRLLFVSRANLPQIVALIAPELALISKDEFTEIASQMLALVEHVVAQQDSRPDKFRV